jgi:hypothetical protein
MSVSGNPCGRSKARWAANQSGRETALLRQTEWSILYCESEQLCSLIEINVIDAGQPKGIRRMGDKFPLTVLLVSVSVRGERVDTKAS